MLLRPCQGQIRCFGFQLGSLDILASSLPWTSPSFAGSEVSGGDIAGVLIKPGCHTRKGHQHHLSGASLAPQHRDAQVEEPQSAPQRSRRANAALKVLSFVNCRKRAPQAIIQTPQRSISWKWPTCTASWTLQKNNFDSNVV